MSGWSFCPRLTAIHADTGDAWAASIRPGMGFGLGHGASITFAQDDRGTSADQVADASGNGYVPFSGGMVTRSVSRYR